MPAPPRAISGDEEEDEKMALLRIGAELSGWRAALTARALVLSLVAALALWEAAGFVQGPRALAPSHRGAATRGGSEKALSSLPLSAQGAISSALGADSAAYRVRASAGRIRADNPAERLHASFSMAGVSVRSGAIAFGLRLLSVGYGTGLHPVAAAPPSARGNHVTLEHGAASEWYANGPLGLEQGFTLAHAPSGASAEPLALTLALTGTARATVADDGRSLALSRPGAPSLRYTGLTATDTRGRSLHSWLQLLAGRLLIRVDARGARYPLRIDPLIQQGSTFIQQGSKLTGGGETGQGKLGYSVALSSDGHTALVSGPGDSENVGAAWVFTRAGSTWTQQGSKLTGGGETGKALFGTSVALSSDGNTALVGGEFDNTSAGAAWVFTRSGSTWTQQGSKLTGSGEVGAGLFGESVALSSDGNTALIGGDYDNGRVGAVWVFTRSGSAWTQQGSKLTGSGVIGEGRFGFSVALSADGNTALVGGAGDNGGVGAVWVFTRSGSTWTQQGSKLTGSGESGEGVFGASVALSADGNTALIGGYGDNSQVGAAWVFTRSGSTWTQQGNKLTGSGESGEGVFGASVALSADGNTALIGGYGDNALGGAAWLFVHSGFTWAQQGSKLTGSGESEVGQFAWDVSLSADGNTIIVGGLGDSNNVGAAWIFTPKLTGSGESGAAGFGNSAALSADGNTALIGGANDNNSAGAVWVFTRAGSTWTQQGSKLTGSGESGAAHLGASVALSADGNTALIGGYADNSSTGAAWVFTRSGSTWTQQGSKLTGSGESGAGQFGASVALSSDGNTALIGGNSDGEGAGAAWVFTRSGSTWTQQGSKLIGSGASGKAFLGASASLSADGNTAVIGGYADNSSAGAAWVFTRSGSVWTQQGSKLTGSGESGAGLFGLSASLSGDGNTALIGGDGDNSFAGAAWVFTRSGSTWTQQGSKLSGGEESGAGQFGASVALSSDGNTALIGGNGDNSAEGAAWVFTRLGGIWTQHGEKLTGSGESGAGQFGAGVAVSSDANTALIGGSKDHGGVGAAWVFVNPPTLTKLKGTSGPVGGGTTVTITGTNFTGAWDVMFGSASATSFKVNSPTSITAVSPPESPGTVDVTVLGLGGTSAISTKDHFKFLPSVTSLSPKEGSKAGGTTVTVTGTGFAPGKTATTMKFGASKGTNVSCASSTECSVSSPAHAAGVVDVTVTVNKATSAKTTADHFTYS